MKKGFVSNSAQSTRMFKSDLLESMSKVHFLVPLILYLPVVGYFIWKGLTNENTTILAFWTSVGGGLLFWTAVEYCLHRFLFHYQPRSKWGKRLHFIFHGVHHDFPNDSMRLVMPPSVSIPLALLFYGLFQILLPEQYFNGAFASFMTGYLFYDMIHYSVHHATFDNPLLKKLKHHHMRHHYQEPDMGFGLSSALWDKILKTDFIKTDGEKN